jgi:hypothetical protein
MQELTKAAWERTKTPEFQAALADSIAEANQGITHDEFVSGMKNKTMGFRSMQGNSCDLIKGFGKLVFDVLVMLYTIAPLLIIPFWAYHEHNWWLLIGIVVTSIIATQLEQIKPYTAGALFLFATVGFWLYGGIHSYFTFFSFCGLWGCMFFRMAEDVQNEYAIQSLVENPDVFKDAIARNKIMVIRKLRP